MGSSKGAWVPDWLRASEGEALTTMQKVGAAAPARTPGPIADRSPEPLGEFPEPNEKSLIARPEPYPFEKDNSYG